MSYILEALKKAEHQRELGQVPGIASEHGAGVRSISRRWLWIVMLAVNAVILLLLALLWLRTDSDASRMPNTVSRAELPATLPVPPVRNVQPTPAPVAIDNEIATLKPVYSRPVDSEWLPPQPAVSPNITTPEPMEDAELPVWPQIPDYLLAQLTNGLRLDVHVYSDRAEDRFVLINLAKYREGETVQDGPVVQEITPRGAVLSLQGHRFRLPAQ